MTGPITRPGIDMLHELGNRALSGSKKSLADVRTLQTFDHGVSYCLFCDASATGSTV
jgi:hypothetical protein